jgi:hypothetical protein
MSKGIGRLIQVGTAKETSRGTAIGSASYWSPWNDLVVDEKKEFAVDEQSYGVIEDNTNLTYTKRWVEGSIAGDLLDQSFGLILYSIFGTLTSHSAHSGESSVYDNVFNVAESAQHQSLTFFLHDPLSGQDYSYANGVVTKLEISAELKKFVEYTASIKALTGAAQSSFTPATTAENRFVCRYAAAKLALNNAGMFGTLTATGTAATTTHVTGVSINVYQNLKVGMGVSGTNIPAGAKIAALVSATAYDLTVATTGAIGTQTFTPATIAARSIKLTINANVEDQDTIGSNDPADFLNKEFSVDGSMDVIWQNETDYKQHFMGTNNSNVPQTLAIQLDIKNTDVTLGSATNPELIISMPKCTITELGRPFKVKDLVYQTVKFRASYSTSDSYMVKATLTNIVNGY